MPRNDPEFYNRVYARYMGCEFIPPTRRGGNVFNIGEHPIWYMRRFHDDGEVGLLLKNYIRKTIRTSGRDEENRGKIPIALVTGTTPKENNVVLLRAGDFRDLCVGTYQVQSDIGPGPGLLEWTLPDNDDEYGF